MRIFITASFIDSKENKENVDNLCSVVRSAGFDDFCFVRDVENYQKIFNDPKELMQRAKEEIQKSDALLIDITDNPTGGRSIEAGIAYALSKRIIVIAKKGMEIKDTFGGIANRIIEYDEIGDILNELKLI